MAVAAAVATAARDDGVATAKLEDLPDSRSMMGSPNTARFVASYTWIVSAAATAGPAGRMSHALPAPLAR